VAAEAATRFEAPRGLVREGEVERFRAIARMIPLGLDPTTGIIEQFSGFHRLEYVDLAGFEPRSAPMDVLLGHARTQASQVVKQADVVQLIAQLWDEIPADVRYKNFLYYEPRTAHGSSLSPGIHALVAARLGLLETAAKYLDVTAHIDLDNSMGNAAGGVHAAGMGSLWQAIVFGVAGVRQPPGDDRVLAFDPHLLPGMRHLGVPLLFRGSKLELHVEPASIQASVEGGAPIVLRAERPTGFEEIEAEPGATYVTRRDEDGFGPWERSSR
jgi:kojibiose phosphorylase